MGKQWLVVLIVIGFILSGCIGDEFLDMDNDGIWDSNKGGTDRDLDNDGIWDR